MFHRCRPISDPKSGYVRVQHVGFKILCTHLEALKLHSMTFTSLSLQMNWMLKGPEIFSALQSFAEILFTLRCVSTKSRCAGSSSVASPLCTPAFSMCSAMA